MHMHTVMCMYVYVNCARNEYVMCGCREHCVCVCMSVCIGPVPTCMDAFLCTACVYAHSCSEQAEFSWSCWEVEAIQPGGSRVHGLYFSFPISHVIAGSTALTVKPWEQIFNEANAHTAVFRYRCFLLVVIDFQLDILERQGVKRKGDTKEAGTVPSQPAPVQS